MVLRVVHIRLRDDCLEAAPDILERARMDFPRIPGVVDFACGVAEDDPLELVLLVGFGHRGDIEGYRSHPVHEAFLADMVKPNMMQLMARNYLDGENAMMI